MTYLTHHWGYPVLALVALLVVAVHERGLRALNARSTIAHARARRQRMWLAYAGIAVLTLSVVSPLQYWSMEYFWVHMIQHVTVMLAAPALYVAGAPAVPLVFALPVATRRRLLRRVFLRPGRPLLRRIGAVVFSPLFAIVFFNVVMVVWMIPSVFNPVMGDPGLHISLMLTSFFVSGLLFWAQFIPSRPWRPTLSPFARVGALLATNVVMTIVAMSLSFLASGPFYDIGNSMLGMAHMSSMVPTTLNPFADQQIGAAILWVCGDFWCYPALVMALRLATKNDTNSSAMDHVLRGRRSMTVEEFRGISQDETVT
ncbi:MAG: cytochrome c oxidase assembly protein [Acidimicrobiales bacterium]